MAVREVRDNIRQTGVLKSWEKRQVKGDNREKKKSPFPIVKINVTVLSVH